MGIYGFSKTDYVFSSFQYITSILKIYVGIFRIYSDLKATICWFHLTNNKFTFFSALVSLAFIFADAFLSFPYWQSNTFVPSIINGIPLKSLPSSLQRILWFWTYISKTRQTTTAKSLHACVLRTATEAFFVYK